MNSWLNQPHDYKKGDRVWLFYDGWHRATITEVWPDKTVIVTPDDDCIILHGPGIATPMNHPSLKPMSPLDQMAEIE